MVACSRFLYLSAGTRFWAADILTCPAVIMVEMLSTISASVRELPFLRSFTDLSARHKLES